jgi:hypothetical protein
LVLIVAYLPSSDTLPICKAMHTLLNTRLTRAALKAARPARRQVVRALRHHSARTRALAEQWRDVRAVDGIRSWFQTFFAVLRARASTRRFSLRTLLRKPARVSNPARAAIANHRSAAPSPAPQNTSRKPRRMSTDGSTGWFAFAFASR